MPHYAPQKILVLRFSSLGDIVMTTPMLRCLKMTFPKAQIDMIVRAEFLDLIKNNPHLNNKIGLSRNEGLKGLLRLRKLINHEKYDVIYDAHRSLRTLCLMPFLNAKRKYYFKKHYIKRSLALTFKLPLLKGFGRFIVRYIDPLKTLGVHYDGKGPELFISEADRTHAISKFPQVKTPPPQSNLRIGLIPSAQWPGKRWPLPYFRSLIEKLLKDTRHELILFGGKEDNFCTELIQGLPQERIINTQGKLSIAEAGAMLEQCHFVIANDTGLMHMADALQKPSLLFLGPTSAEMGCLPFHPQSVVLEHALWCRPCSKNGEAPCIRSERFCLTRTSPENAFLAAQTLARKLMPT